MKRALVMVAVLCLAGVAQPAITVSVVQNGTYTTSAAAATGYDVTLNATGTDCLAAVDLTFSGAVYQAGAYGKKTTIANLTPTEQDATDFLDAPEMDSHFMCAFNAVVTNPTETNDKSIYNPNAPYTIFEGIGNLWVKAGFPLPLVQEKLLAHIVVLDSDLSEYCVCLNGRVWNAAGVIYPINWPPEPGTLALLCAGCAVVFRRRR